MEKKYKVENPKGELLEATFEEAKKNGYTIIVHSLQELLEEHFDKEGVVFSINFREAEKIESDEPFFYEGEPVLPDDPKEGEEGYDDKMIYD